MIVDARRYLRLGVFRGLLPSLRESSQEPGASVEACVQRLLQARDLEASLSGVVGILDDYVTVIWGVEVYFQDGRELVRVDAIHHRDDQSRYRYKASCEKRKHVYQLALIVNQN